MMRIKVVVRVRPLSNREVLSGASHIVCVKNGNTVEITNIKVSKQNTGDNRERVRRFTFDYCFEDKSTQEQIFEKIEKVILQSIKQKHHSCILAYGQSASGKTHTIMGCPNDPGLTPKLCHSVFDYLKEVNGDAVAKNISVSYLEIYNEKVRDLLCCEGINSDIIRKNQVLKIREHPRKGPYVQGLSAQPVAGSADLLNWLERGNKQRRVSSTLSNPQSSRSHSVFSINCDGVKLHIIDLAGSERTHNRYCRSQFREGANINKSLVALGNVISALAEHAFSQTKSLRRKFIPYRGSVLTWLLKDSLGGNSNTVMVATVSPSSSCYSETLNTLRFGQRARLIVSYPVVNEDPKDKTIRELKAEIAKLRKLFIFSQVIPMIANKTLWRTDEIFKEKEDNNRIISKLNDSYSATSETDDKILETSIPGFHSDEKGINFIGTDIEIESSNKKPFQDVSTDLSNIENSIFLPTIHKNEDSKAEAVKEILLPLINVNSIIPPRPTNLKRTFSVDHAYFKMERKKSKIFSSDESIPYMNLFEKQKSQESINSTSFKSTVAEDSADLLRRSLYKSNPSLPKITATKKSENNSNKIEKTAPTDVFFSKKNETNIESIKKQGIKPRSQIVAAVTSRLYSKSKKKDVATDTDDINVYNKERVVTANARSRLCELTRRALKAYRQKTVETQTDLYPVLRLKEVSTDVIDLKIALLELKDAETMSELFKTKDASIDCTLFEQPFNNSRADNIFFTRTCGTQSCDQLNNHLIQQNLEESKNKNSSHLKTMKTPSNLLSFTKYLSNEQNSKFEVSELTTCNPIYTNAVSINISHNYIGENITNSINNSNSISNDSLNESSMDNVGFPTPDLISNHNSLEQHYENYEPIKLLQLKKLNDLKLYYGDMEILQDQLVVEERIIDSDENKRSVIANCYIAPKCTEKLQSINIPKVQAPVICITNDFQQEICTPFPKFNPELVKPKIIKYRDIQCEDCIRLAEPLVLKSFVKHLNDIPKVSNTDSYTKHETADQATNCCFYSESQGILKSVSQFLEEATHLIQKFSVITNKERKSDFNLDDSYNVEIIVNDIKGLKKNKKNKRKKVECSICQHNSTELHESQIINENMSSYFPESEINSMMKYYEILLENSCKRLEEKIKEISSIDVHTKNEINGYDNENCSQNGSFWNAYNKRAPCYCNAEDSSVDNVTFSDYGSLPKKNHKSHRVSTCSPSAFLKQLTNMRKQIMESSREE